MENQLPVGERDLADNSENFALVNEIIPTADTYNIENIVTTTTAKAALGAHKESVAEGFSDSLFAKLLGVGHRFSSDIQGVKGEQQHLSVHHPHQQREPMMLLEAESMMKLEVLLTSILVILSILSILIILLTLMLSRQWRRSRTKCKLHSPASNTIPSPSHLQLAGVGMHPHNYPLPPPPNGEERGRGDVVSIGRFSVGQGQQVVDMSSCQVHGAKYHNNNTNIWCVDSRSANPRYSMPTYAKSMGHELATVESGYYTSQQNLIRSVSAYHTKIPDNFSAASVNGRPVSYHAGPPPLPSISANASLLLTPLDLDLERSTSFATSVASQQDGEIVEPIYQEISDSVIKKKEKEVKATHEDLALADKNTESATKAKETENNESSDNNADRTSDAVSNPTKATSGVVYGMITAKQAAKFIPCTQTIIVRD